MIVNGCTLRVPTSGGKAGKNRNRTGTVQVLSGGCLVKQYRFVVADKASRDKAWNKAVEHARSL